MNVITRVELKNIVFEYQPGQTIFDGMGFEVPAHKICRLHTEGGPGKSTILRMLAGLVSPDDGEIVFNNEVVSNMSFEEFRDYRLRVGYAFDTGGLLSNRSILNNLTLPFVYHNVLRLDQAIEYVEEFLKDYHVFDRRHELPAAVSGGMRKEACVLRSLLLDPDLLLLDEPFTGLSDRSKQVFVDQLVKRRKSGACTHVLVVSDKIESLTGLIDQELYIESKPAERAVA